MLVWFGRNEDLPEQGWLLTAGTLLGFHGGNRRHGVALPHHYLSAAEWSAAIARLGLTRARWDVGGLGLYPWPASLVFGARLHVLARLDVDGGGA